MSEILVLFVTKKIFAKKFLSAKKSSFSVLTTQEPNTQTKIKNNVTLPFGEGFTGTQGIRPHLKSLVNLSQLGAS